MVDTVKLRFDFDQNGIVRAINGGTYDYWEPSLRGIVVPPYRYLSPKCRICSHRNPTNREKKASGYLPRLTLFKQGFGGGVFKYYLYVEFSAPKLVYGNNFQTVSNVDFDRICKILRDKLKSYYGVSLNLTAIQNAYVQAIHYCVNIILPKNIPVAHITSMLAKTTVNKRITSNKYSDGGCSLHISTSKKCICFYDKYQELKKAKKTEKGNLEKDNWVQLNVLDKYKNQNILRIEVRLLDKKTIGKELEKVHISCNSSSFKILFDKEKSKQVLVEEYLQILIGIPDCVYSHRTTITDYGKELRRLNPEMKPARLAMIMATKVILEDGASGDLRLIVGNPPKRWYDWKKRLDEPYRKPRPPTDIFSEIDKQLDLM